MRRKIWLLTLVLTVAVVFVMVFNSCGHKTALTSPSFNATLEDLHQKYKDNPALFDAAVQASYLGITIEEVQSRSKIIDSFQGLEAELENNEPETFAGLWIQQTPNFCIAIAFTRGGEETIKKYVSANLTAYVEVRTVKYSYMELQKARVAVESFLKGEQILFNSGIYVMKNQVGIRVTDRTRIDAAILEGTLVVPECVDITVGGLAVAY